MQALLDRVVLTRLVGQKSGGMRTTTYGRPGVSRNQRTVTRPGCRVRVSGTQLTSQSLTTRPNIKLRKPTQLSGPTMPGFSAALVYHWSSANHYAWHPSPEQCRLRCVIEREPVVLTVTVPRDSEVDDLKTAIRNRGILLDVAPTA